ncbi:MAG: hypothetical protein PHT58_07905 [Eubacteriales bacterium]|nr:hypothetical protein [Eubacteriales bacterium]
MDIRDIYQSNQGKSEDELMSELETMTREQRASGEMDNSKMEEIYEMLYPMLSESQRAKMREVIRRLKE